jgi:uncharacterized protein (TIGR00255 family)
MSVYSMTGYAQAMAEASDRGRNEVPSGTPKDAAREPRESPKVAASTVASVELRSVNGRFLDLSMRMPDELRGLEPQLRELVSSGIRRGKVELRINTQREQGHDWPQPTAEQVNQLMRLEGSVQSWLPQARGLSVNEILNWCRGAAPAERIDDAVLGAAKRALAGLRESRAREGARLVQVMLEKVARLRELATLAEPMIPAVVQRQQQRFLERWNEALANVQAGSAASSGAATISNQALQDRALNEAAAFAIRIDVAEELARLRAHLQEVERLLTAGGEVGKKLDFLMQELQREANTLGSKSAALELTNVSVEMKVAIEQLREQVQNLE